MGAPAVAVTSRLAHSSAEFSKGLSEAHVEGAPTSSATDRRVVVEWRPNERSRLYVPYPLPAHGVLMSADSHNIWLRDHCRCSECYHPVTKQRLLDTFDVSGLSIFPLWLPL